MRCARSISSRSSVRSVAEGRTRIPRDVPERRIVGFHRDDEGTWEAELNHFLATGVKLQRDEPS